MADDPPAHAHVGPARGDSAEWVDFCAWRKVQDRTAPPAFAATVTQYLTTVAASLSYTDESVDSWVLEGRVRADLERRLTAIRQAHDLAGCTAPALDEVVPAVMERFKRAVQLLDDHRGLAARAVGRYISKYPPRNSDDRCDLENAAKFAVWKASWRYDPDDPRRAKFTTFAAPFLRNAFFEAWLDNVGMSRPEQGVKSLVAGVERELRGQLEREPSADEVVRALGEQKGMSDPAARRLVEDARSLEAKLAPVSLDSPARSAADESDPLSATIRDPTAPGPGSSDPFELPGGLGKNPLVQLYLSQHVEGMGVRPREAALKSLVNEFVERVHWERKGITPEQKEAYQKDSRLFDVAEIAALVAGSPLTLTAAGELLQKTFVRRAALEIECGRVEEDALAVRTEEQVLRRCRPSLPDAEVFISAAATLLADGQTSRAAAALDEEIFFCWVAKQVMLTENALSHALGRFKAKLVQHGFEARGRPCAPPCGLCGLFERQVRKPLILGLRAAREQLGLPRVPPIEPTFAEELVWHAAPVLETLVETHGSARLHYDVDNLRGYLQFRVSGGGKSARSAAKSARFSAHEDKLRQGTPRGRPCACALCQAAAAALLWLEEIIRPRSSSNE